MVRLLAKPRLLLNQLLPCVVIAEALGEVGEVYEEEGLKTMLASERKGSR